jgi:hypothetical protein
MISIYHKGRYLTIDKGYISKSLPEPVSKHLVYKAMFDNLAAKNFGPEYTVIATKGIVALLLHGERKVTMQRDPEGTITLASKFSFEFTYQLLTKC